MTKKNKVSSLIQHIIILLCLVLFLNIIFVTYVGYVNSAFTNLSVYQLIRFYKNQVFILEHKDDTGIDLNFNQERIYTCGPAALKYLLHYFGIVVSEEELVELMSTTETGSSLYDIKDVLNKYRLTGEGLYVNYTKLKEINMPVIGFVKNDHFVVINEVTNRYVYIFDPDPKYGYIKISKEFFLEAWNGVILKVYTKPI